MQMIPVVLVLVGMMFFMNRQQKKQRQQQEDKLNGMNVGDTITTIGGLHGKLHSIDTTKGLVTIDCDGVLLDFDRAAVRSVTPVASFETPTLEEKVVEKEETEQQ